MLSDDFNARINLLPPKYDADTRFKYSELIRLHGTHWINEFDLGAQMRAVAYISVCRSLLEGLSISEIRHCLEVYLGIAFGLDGLTNSTQFHDCEEMSKKYYIEKYLETEGSQELGFYTHTPKEWLENAKFSPGLLSSSIEPIHTLLDKGDPRRAEVKKAVST